jgi:hypothetical protein
MTVKHEYCDAVAALDAEGGEATGECIGALVKVVPGVACVATNDGLASSKDFFRVCQPLCDVHMALSLLMVPMILFLAEQAWHPQGVPLHFPRQMNLDSPLVHKPCTFSL